MNMPLRERLGRQARWPNTGRRVRRGAVLATALLTACTPAQLVTRSGASGGYLPVTAPPTLMAGREYWADGFDAAYAVARRNLHPPSSFHPVRHTRAAPAIRGVHLWDSAFLSHVWNAWDPSVAQDVLIAVLKHARGGRVPHFSHPLRRSELTPPPLIAWAVWQNHLWTRDTAYLATVYPALRAYNEWLYEHRRLPSGLFFWASPLESGKDNSPRFDSVREGGAGDLRELGAIDLSSYVVVQNAALARIALALGLPEEAAEHERRAVDLRERINELTWDEASGYYFDRDEKSGELLEVRTAASLLPLFAGVPDPARARRLRDHAMDPACFGSLLPLPSVALDDPRFARDMWRGPVWINVSYMIIRGLDEYGFADEAAELAFRTVDGVFRTHQTTGRLWEFYDPQRFDVRALNRKRDELLKQITLGNKPLPDYGWSALTATLVIEQLVGYRLDEGRRTISPRLPTRARGMPVQLTLPREDLVIRFVVDEHGATQGEVTSGSGTLGFELAAGERLVLPAGGIARRTAAAPARPGADLRR